MSVKRLAASNIFSTTHKMEKDFLNAPAKLNIQLNKTISALKHKENKLKHALTKGKSQTKTSANRVKLVRKTKSTKVGKKQFLKAKKAYVQLLKDQTILNKQLQETAKQLKTAALKQAKLVALRKHLSKFEKEWHKSAKKVKVKTSKLKAKKQIKTKPFSEQFEHPQKQPEFEIERIPFSEEIAS